MPMKLYVGDVIQTRKKHPCGGDQWEIMRVGMDFRIRCTTCDHQVWIPRVKLEKSIKKVLYPKDRVIRTADVIVMKIFACGNC